MKIAVSNFQSLQKTSLEYDGFSVVTGESNKGKSALIRAAGGAIFGIPGDHYVRWGTSASAVGVRFDDTLTIKWQKVPADKKRPGLETTLDVNGVAHTKLGKDHFGVLDDLGFLKISTAAGDILPQVAGQFDKAFLLDVNETVVAEVFKVLGRGDVVTSARDSARKDLAKNKSELKVRESDLDASRKSVAQRVWVRQMSKDVEDTLRDLSVAAEKDRVREGCRNLLQSKIPEVIPEVPTLPALDDKIRILQGIKDYKEINIPEIPECVEPPSLGMLVKVQGWMEEGVRLDSEGILLNQRLEESKKELKALEDSLGACPTCGKSFEESFCGV